MKRIILHWSAGTGLASTSDREHYHVLIESDGTVIAGRRAPEANRSTSDGDYAAHTRAMNTGSIGVAVCAMRGAQESPFRAGSNPITPAQVTALAGTVADLCVTYNIPVTRETVLTHAEVQPTLGVWQRGKWDICWLPGMDKPGDPLTVGDDLRGLILAEMPNDTPLTFLKRLMAWLASLAR